MKTTLLFVAIFAIGFGVGSADLLPDLIAFSAVKTVILNSLLLFIGIGVGLDQVAFGQLRRLDFFSALVPLLIALGSILGAGLAATFLPLVGFHQGLAVGAGFGFYSLSSIILTDLVSAELGAIALIANLSRELATILLAPLLVRLLGRLALVASAGATSMDICLPVIQRFSGNRYTVIAILNGVILTILVPLLVPIFVR